MQRTGPAVIAPVEKQEMHTVDVETFKLEDAAPPQNRPIRLASLSPPACRFQGYPIEQVAE